MPGLSAASLVSGLIFGSIGFVAFVYGKRMNLWKMMLCGLVLMTYPYFVENMPLSLGIGFLGTAALPFLRD
jgi:predicted membrane-bound dolichyl-phosphate-mannose-protein mannosyltransferase